MFFSNKGEMYPFWRAPKVHEISLNHYLGMQMKVLIGIPYDYKRCPTRGKLTMASWESFASQHLYLFHFLVDTQGCRFGPEKIPPPGPLGTHQYLDPYQTIWKPALFPKMYRRLISNLDTHQKTKNPPETKPIGIRETYVRKHSDGKTPLTWAGVLHSWRRKSCELATWRAYTPGTCFSLFFGLQPSQKMALSKQNKGHFPGSRFRFQVYLGSSSPQITRQIPRLWYSVSKQGSSMEENA